jgi:hypothetical protein
MVSIALQVENETTANSGDLQNPVSPPSDVEEVAKAENKELRSLYPPAECNTDLAFNL